MHDNQHTADPDAPATDLSDGAGGSTAIEAAPGDPPGHTIMFWVLIGMAAMVFAPCVLVPIWAENQEIKEYERALAGVMAELEARVERNDLQIAACLADPLVNDRMVRRELNFRPEDEAVVEWAPHELSSLRIKSPGNWMTQGADAFEDYPAWLETLRSWLPNWPWRRLFAESPNRQMMLCMAGGLLLCAFLLYGRGAPRRSAH